MNKRTSKSGYPYKNRSKRNPIESFVNRFPHMEPDEVRNIYKTCQPNEEKAIQMVTELDLKNFEKKYPLSITQEEMNEMITEVKGDLFTSKDSLAHCVSKDLAMGKGIAALFVKHFGGKDELKSQNKNVGEVAFLKRGDRFIFYMITKEKYWHIPSYENLYKSLKYMAQMCLDNKITRLSMPVIACGLDRLKWSKVKELIAAAFSKSGVKITIYVWG